LKVPLDGTLDFVGIGQTFENVFIYRACDAHRHQSENEKGSGARRQSLSLTLNPDN